MRTTHLAAAIAAFNAGEPMMLVVAACGLYVAGSGTSSLVNGQLLKLRPFTAEQLDEARTQFTGATPQQLLTAREALDAELNDEARANAGNPAGRRGAFDALPAQERTRRRLVADLVRRGQNAEADRYLTPEAGAGSVWALPLVDSEAAAIWATLIAVHEAGMWPDTASAAAARAAINGIRKANPVTYHALRSRVAALCAQAGVAPTRRRSQPAAPPPPAPDTGARRAAAHRVGAAGRARRAAGARTVRRSHRPSGARPAPRGAHRARCPDHHLHRQRAAPADL